MRSADGLLELVGEQIDLAVDRGAPLVRIVGGLECHPLTYRRGALRPNELYVPAEQFLAALPPAGPIEPSA